MTSSPITIFVPEIEAFGGAERSVVALSRWLHERGCPHRLLLYYDAIDLSAYADHPIKRVILNPARNPRSKIAALKDWFGALPVNAPKPLMSGIQAATHASIAGIRGFHTLMHDTPSLLGDGAPSLGSRLRRVVSNWALSRGLNSGGITIVTSEYLKAESVRLWHPPVMIARMGGVIESAFRPRPIGRKLHLLSVSRIEANKRIDWILRSLAELERRTPNLHDIIDWHLNVAGGGSRIEALTALAAQLGLAARVTFHGFVSDARLEDLYNCTDLFLMPARQGYGIPAAEALARGIPVLLHRESGISDLLRDTPWAVILEGGEAELPDVLERAIKAVIAGEHVDIAPPRIPTEAEWAERVARCCGWYGGDDITI